MRREYEMSEAQLATLLAAMQPVPYIAVGNSFPRDPQARANDAWKRLGRELGFDHMSVLPVDGKGDRFFTAEPVHA